MQYVSQTILPPVVSAKLDNDHRSDGVGNRKAAQCSCDESVISVFYYCECGILPVAMMINHCVLNMLCGFTNELFKSEQQVWPIFYRFLLFKNCVVFCTT